MNLIKERLGSWIKSWDLPWIEALLISLSCAVFLSITFSSRVADLFAARVTRPLVFKLREQADQQPRLDPRIKIISFDDYSVSVLGKHDLTLRDWATIFLHIDSYQPAKIYVDKRWSLPIGKNFDRPVDAKEGREFVDRLSKMQAELISGGTVFERKFKFQEPLDLSDPSHQIKTYLQDSESKDLPSWLTDRKAYPYGPSIHIRDAFDRIGHFDYRPGKEGFVDPMVRLGKKHVFPHFALYSADKVQISKSGLWIDGQEIGVADDGSLPVNFSDRSELSARTQNLYWFIKAINSKKDLGIKKNDIVVILPLMFTGNVDFVQTPLGRLQGGYVPVSIINSVLTKRWILPYENHVAAIFAATLLALFIAVRLKAGRFWLAFAGGFLLIGSAGILSFVFADCEISWVQGLSAFTLNAAIIHARQAYLADRKNRRLREALAGTISDEKIAEIIANPALLRMEPSERYVTIMFIDMVGFSLVAEKLAPQEIFKQLKQHLQKLTQMIHLHGGIIDKNLGDGILCFFGYDYTGTEKRHDHAQDAIECAVAIQKYAANLALEGMKQNQPIIPVRIGINTTNAFVGDVGDARRVDFTLIGHGVNFASRLEGACEPFRLMLGPETFSNLHAPEEFGGGLQKRLVQIKHHDHLMEAYELNPFFNDAELLNQAMNAYRQYMSISRTQERFRLRQADSLMVVGEFGEASIVNVSISGYAIRCASYLGKGVTQTVSLRARDAKLEKKLQSTGFMPFTVEVCWGSFDEKSQAYLLGLRIKNLNASQRDTLFELTSPLLQFETGLKKAS